MILKYGHVFSKELKLCNEDSIIIYGELFLRGTNFSNFAPCVQLFPAEVSLVRHFVATAEIHTLSRGGSRDWFCSNIFTGEGTAGVECTGAIR